ncbi:MAG TPA: HupE/UreJ family protein [Novosphingobium sp.]|nr:HupE/UreJ family protein [Novosphingobium sp.]
MKALLSLLIAMAAALVAPPARAHEVRPAYLEIAERSNGTADVLWKHPSMGKIAVALRPRIDGLIDRKPDTVQGANSFSVARWSEVRLGKQGLKDRTVRVDGLDSTITDTLLVIRLANGETVQRILTPSAPEFHIDARDGAAVPAYLALGFEHILTGIDHLLFVFGLILLSAGFRQLARTITAFTVAHSITLGLTAMGVMNVSPSLVEALVALSILYLGVELVRKRRGKTGLTIRYPWVIAFGFGLLHGAAFAGALKEIGLPAGNIPAALLLFNLGVELGQLAFVALVSGILLALARVRLPDAAPGFGHAVATYAIGVFSSFWFFERLHAAFATIS